MSENRITEKECLERFIAIFHYEASLKEDIKNLSEEADAVGIDAGPIKAAAKLIASQKEAAWVDKMEEIKAVLDSHGE